MSLYLQSGTGNGSAADSHPGFREGRTKFHSPEALFSEAARSWLDSRDSPSARVRYLHPRTIKTYRLEIEALILFFGKMRLCDITNESIRSYQQKRSDGARPFKHQRSPGHVNMEVRKLQEILLRANLWHLLADDYERLRKPFDQPKRVMTKQEEAHLFAIAASRLEFAFIYAYALLSVSTSASGAELRGLRLIDVDLIGRTLQVNAASAKNAARVRSIPMVDDAVWAASSLVNRAKQLGSVEPYHYLFPYRYGRSPYDPTRHMSDNGIQARWNALRKAAGMPWLTGHVLRYQCITKMAEGGVDRIMAKRVAGHVTDQMWDKYSQVRFDSIREKLMGAFQPLNPEAARPKEPVPRREPVRTKGKKQNPPSQDVAASRPQISPPVPPGPRELPVGVNTWFRGGGAFTG
jgi:integrase